MGQVCFYGKLLDGRAIFYFTLLFGALGRREPSLTESGMILIIWLPGGASKFISIDSIV